MADEDPNFATPGQIKAQRDMAEALLKQSMITPVGRVGEAVSPFAIGTQMADALAGSYIQNKAAQREKASLPELPLPAGASGTALAPVGASGGATGALPAGAAAYAPLINSASSSFGIPSEFLTNQIGAESSFRPNARGGKGEIGIAQFMPATAAQYGVNPADPKSAIPGAAHYDSDLTKQFGGNIGLGLAAYNWGPGNVKHWLNSGANPNAVPAITRAYVQKITGKPLEAWLTGPQASVGGQQLAYAGDPAQAPIKDPNSPQAMSGALSGQPAGPPPQGAEDATMQVAGAAPRVVPGSPGTPTYSTVGAKRDPNAQIGARTPPRMQVTREQAVRASNILHFNPTDPVATATINAYMQQNQPIEAKTAYGGTLLLDPHNPNSAPIVIPGEGHWGEQEREIPGAFKQKGPVWQGVAPPGSSFGPPQIVSPGGGAPLPAPHTTAPAEPPGPPPPALIPPDRTPAPPEGKKSEAEGKTRVASLETGTMTDAGTGPTAGPDIGPALAGKPPEGTTQPAIPTSGPPEGGTKTAQAFPGWDAPDAALVEWGKQYTAEKGALADLYKKDVETYNKNLGTFREGETSAYSSIPQLKILQSIINDAHTIQGPFADPKLGMATIFAALGDKASMKYLDFNGAMDKIVNSSIMKEMHNQLAGWAGQVRNSEILMLTKAMASKHNTLAANRAIVDIYMKYADQAKHLGEIARGYSTGWRYDEKGQPHYVGSNADRPTTVGLDSAIKTYLRNNPLYSDEEIFGKGGTKEHPTGGFMRTFQDDEAYKEHSGVHGTATTGYGETSRPLTDPKQIERALQRRQQKPASFNDRWPATGP